MAIKLKAALFLVIFGIFFLSATCSPAKRRTAIENAKRLDSDDEVTEKVEQNDEMMDEASEPAKRNTLSDEKPTEMKKAEENPSQKRRNKPKVVRDELPESKEKTRRSKLSRRGRKAEDKGNKIHVFPEEKLPF